VVDLEDAVPGPQKSVARSLTAEVLTEPANGIDHLVRVNPVSEPELLRADIDALVAVLPHIDGVVLPKVVSAGEVDFFDELVRAAIGAAIPIVATIENAAGVHQSWSIAQAQPSVHTLMFGVIDLSAELGVTPTPDGYELLLARSTLVLACAAAGRARPIDGPHPTIGDVDALVVSAGHARQLGYGGKVAIHPSQLAPIRSAFAPSAGEVAWAQSVLEAYESALASGVGAIRLDDGTFVDAPVADRARGILRDFDLATTAAQGGT